jgi:hypothetical protein
MFGLSLRFSIPLTGRSRTNTGQDGELITIIEAVIGTFHGGDTGSTPVRNAKILSTSYGRDCLLTKVFASEL